MSQIPPSVLQAFAAGLSGSAPVSSAGPMWVHVTQRFRAFLGNLELTPAQILDGQTKFQGVVSCLNTAYYGNGSTSANAFSIGSWAKGTHTRPPRDVDLYFLLPLSVYQRFEAYGPGVNKQSALLQEVKSKLVATYPRSSIKGDGPVVIAGFGSYNVEIVPAFVFDAVERSYYVCDTKNGGSYSKTMPWHEVDKINDADARNNSNVRPLVRMLKCWQAYCSVPIKSFHLELLAIEFLDQWGYRLQSLFYYDWLCRDFFGWMIGRANTFLRAPGTYEMLWLGDAWKSRVESAYGRAARASDFERANDMANAGTEWQKIFGFDIPKYV
ncbi:SMODS domain-containing nucleotidyltransferase [Cupriavidus alkaliphilus]|uniref:SMODS domain-containing nucleotidyltransferase n=1 Tax=Cupriavidus alkaliphilus TaxID=942866 RepID=UPI00339D7487